MWIDLQGLANLRDVGGIPTVDGGKIIPGRLLRSDNLQTLSTSDVDQLLGLGLTDVIDMRSDYEVKPPAYGFISTRFSANGKSV
jgi:protein tyrosine/serine phosphatase